MLKCHPGLDDKDFGSAVAFEIKQFDLTGHVSKPVIKLLFNLFSWQLIEGSTAGAYTEKDAKIKAFFDKYDLSRFDGPTIIYSAVLFYTKLKDVIDFRALEKGEVITVKGPSANKLFSEVNFPYGKLYDFYKEGKGDLSDDFLLFNSVFRNTPVKEVEKLRSYGEVVNTSKANLIRPDFSYKLATKNIDVNRYIDEGRQVKDKIYVLQDCTLSMRKFLPNISTIKGFILNEAFKNGYEVEWLCINTDIKKRETYNKDNIKNIDINIDLIGIKVDTSSILIRDELTNKKVVIITDGTDSFDFPFNTKTKSVNIISFVDNIKIKNKLAGHGKFFKAYKD